jgi:hypothetical protein
MATAWSCKTKRRGRSRGIGQVAVDRRPMSPLPGAWYAALRCKALWAASDQGYTPKVPVTSGGTARNRVIGPSVARLSEAWRTTARRARHVGRHSPVGYLFLQKFASCKGARSFLSVRSDVVCCTGRTCSSTGEETRLALLCEDEVWLVADTCWMRIGRPCMGCCGSSGTARYHSAGDPAGRAVRDARFPDRHAMAKFGTDLVKGGWMRWPGRSTSYEGAGENRKASVPRKEVENVMPRLCYVSKTRETNPDWWGVPQLCRLKLLQASGSALGDLCNPSGAYTGDARHPTFVPVTQLSPTKVARPSVQTQVQPPSHSLVASNCLFQTSACRTGPHTMCMTRRPDLAARRRCICHTHLQTSISGPHWQFRNSTRAKLEPPPLFDPHRWSSMRLGPMTQVRVAPGGRVVRRNHDSHTPLRSGAISKYGFACGDAEHIRLMSSSVFLGALRHRPTPTPYLERGLAMNCCTCDELQTTSRSSI